MVLFETINAASPHLESVKALGRYNKATLGYLPDGGFEDHAHDRHIVVALDEGACVGYVLYRIVRERVNIAHFCVATTARGKGIAREMLAYLADRTAQQRGILLSCRRDFSANTLWPHLGFHWLRTIPGRAAGGSELDRWALDYHHRDLFSGSEESAAIDAAIDANIFLDLSERQYEETEWLLADWIQPFINLCYTPELRNDFNRHPDSAIRQRRLAEVLQYKLLNCSLQLFNKSEKLLRPLFPDLRTPQDISDFYHLVRAYAAEADVFVTRDEKLRARAEEVFDLCRLEIVRPAELVAKVHVLLNEREYQRDLVAGTHAVKQQRVSCIDADLLDAIQVPNEQKRKLESALNLHLADSNKSACHEITGEDGTILAAYVVEHDGENVRVPILRISAKRQAGTLARGLLTGIVRKAHKDGAKTVYITESKGGEVVRSACGDLGFLSVAGGQLKLITRGWISVEEAASQLIWDDPQVAQLRAALSQARTDASLASHLEHLIWPGKLANSCLPSFIVAIAAEFAEQLFEERFARRSLFGADVDLALNPESAYYRAAKPWVLRCPARVLWYVKDSQVVAGAKTIRACSRIVELACDTPKRLFRRFRRLGVYEWRHVLATADGDHDKKIMAFRFDDTELLPPIGWQHFQEILAANGRSNPLQGPVEIAPHVFGEIYAAALNSPASC